MPYKYKATGDFWDDLRALSPSQRTSAQRAWEIFRADPFDPRLRTHKIHRLSAHYQRTVYAARVEADLRVVFFICDDEIWSLAIGTHDLYKS
jgi:Txe/YoeB family toxin of Txe-Axe toxin-antitoxin module